MYKSRDLWGAAFLVVYGFGMPTLEASVDRPGLWEFCFPDSPEIRAAYREFRDGDDVVGAKAYRSAVRNLKRLLAEQFHTFEGEHGDAI